MTEGPAAPRLRLTDTTFRDGNQSLFGGRILPRDLLPVASLLDGVGLYSMEAFGGATFETYLTMGEDPWEYLRALRSAVPHTPLQALVRGQNLVAHRNFADDVVELFVRHCATCGVDVFRVFDPLNDPRNMEATIAAAKTAGRRVQGALCYAISPAHDLDLWCSLAARLANLGCDEVVVKDTSGLLSPQVAWELVTALGRAVQCPIAVHSHCSSGMAPMAYMAAIEAGAAMLDTALSPLAWGMSQPATESVVAALAGGHWDTGLDLGRLAEAKDALEVVRRRYQEHQSPLSDRVDSDILRYQVPGLMLDDVYRRLRDLGAEPRLREVLDEVSRVRAELGHPPLVSPIRNMIAAQAVLNVTGDRRYGTVTHELKDYLQGLYGSPPVAADPAVRRAVLGTEEPITIRPADLLEPQVAPARARLGPAGEDDGTALVAILFPELSSAYVPGGSAPASPSPAGEAEPAGEDVQDEVVETGEALEAAAAGEDPPAEVAPPPPATAEFQVEVEGETYTVRVTGQAVTAAGGRVPAGVPPPPAPPAPREGAVAAPMQGLIVKVPVKVGDEVALGDVVAVLEAMKMQNDIVATRAGKVIEVYVKEGEVVAPHQPLLAIG
ncbi:MAG: pyruvate carboxylase subunit B [Candidatus Dormibacterales bacterium]